MVKIAALADFLSVGLVGTLASMVLIPQRKTPPQIPDLPTPNPALVRWLERSRLRCRRASHCPFAEKFSQCETETFCSLCHTD